MKVRDSLVCIHGCTASTSVTGTLLSPTGPVVGAAVEVGCGYVTGAVTDALGRWSAGCSSVDAFGTITWYASFAGTAEYAPSMIVGVFPG